jgi:tripartite-type tricarboxylate transporter receptor subunit TctC
MGFCRRRFLSLAACAAVVSTVAQPALAQSYPSRPVTMVIPFAVGGSSDVAGRIIASRVSEILGQQIVVENVGGAGGMIGTSRVAKAAPDGYQFVLGSVGTHAQNQTLYKKPLYNAATDFAPVVLLAEQPMVLVARKTFPASNLQEFIAFVKANQEKIQYGSSGAGSSSHVSCALLNAAIGINVTHVPYRGGGAVTQDLLARLIDYSCNNAPSATSLMEGNHAKAIAALTKNRSTAVPALASAHEQGLMNFEVDSWLAFFFPKGTPTPIVQKLHDAAVAALDTPVLQTRMKELGVVPVEPERRSPEYLQRFVESQIAKWAGAIKAAGVSAD